MWHDSDNARRRKSKGFTLVELLAVISILMVLVMLLMPAVNAAKRSMYKMNLQARITELDGGARTYSRNNFNCFPGQLDPNRLTGSSDGGRSGSQVLAACLFGYYSSGTSGIDTPTPTVSANYASYKLGDLLKFDPNQSNSHNNAIWDRVPGNNKMVICYYPARLGYDDLTQYIENDNTWWTGNTSWCSTEDPSGKIGSTGFQHYIKDRRFNGASSTVPYNKGEFLILAPAVTTTRSYGTSQDLHNW